MTKRETIKFIVQMIASIATAIVTALGATSCMGAQKRSFGAEKPRIKAKDLHLRGSWTSQAAKPSAPLILQRGEFKKEILFSYIIQFFKLFFASSP